MSSYQFSQLLRDQRVPIADGPGELLGLEFEYEVFEGGQRCDFRDWIHPIISESPIRNRPVGADAYMHEGGTLLICDGKEAEIAIPPVRLNPRQFDKIADLARWHQQALSTALSSYNHATESETLARGYSTHISFSASLFDIDALCQLYLRRFAPAMMLFEGFAGSPGLFTRPRSRRFEIGGEFIRPSDNLTVAAIVAYGTYLAAVEEMVAGNAFPIQFDPEIQITPHRFGYFTSAEAFGDNLYTRGRDAVLRTADGSSITGQELLLEIWEFITPLLEDRISIKAMRLINAFVDGRRALPSEVQDLEAYTALDDCRRRRKASKSPYDLKPVSNECYSLDPSVITWDFVVYRLEENEQTIFINVPRRYFEHFPALFQDGVFDSLFAEVLAQGGNARLASTAVASAPGIFDEIDEDNLIMPMTGGRSVISMKKKKPPEHEDPLCVVLVDEEEEEEIIEIYIPETTDPQQAVGPQEPPQNDYKIAHNVWTHNGSFTTDFADFYLQSLGMDFEFTRTYRSSTRYNGLMGQCWDHHFNIRVVPHPPPGNYRPVRGGWAETFSPALRSGSLTFHHGTGRVTEHEFVRWQIREMDWCGYRFVAIVTTYAQNDGEDFEIERYAVLSGKAPPVIRDPIFYRMRVRDGTRVLFNCHGYAVEIRDRNFNAFTLAYAPPFNPATGYFTLNEITDSSGRKHTLAYKLLDGSPRLEYLTDFQGKQVQYQYDSLVQLETVALIAGAAGRPRLRYRYKPGGRPGLLTENVQPIDYQSGKSYIQNEYDQNERVYKQRVGSAQGVTPSAGGTYSLDYSTPNQIKLTDRAGTEKLYELRDQGATKVVIRESLKDDVIINNQVATDHNVTTSMSYDAHFHITQVVRPEGSMRIYAFRNNNQPVLTGDEIDDVNLQVAHYNDLGRDALLMSVQMSANGAINFATRYEYEWLYNSVTKISSPTGVTEFEYDHGICHMPERNGNPVKVIRPDQLEPDGSAVTVEEKYEYTTGGLIQWFCNADCEEHSFLYDGKGMALYHFLGTMKVASCFYDDRSNVQARYDERNQKWAYGTDDRGNVTTEVDPLGHSKTATFDLNDRLISAQSRRVDDGTTITGITAVPGLTFEQKYVYDVLGNRTSMEHVGSSPGAASQKRSWSWGYDGEERVIRENTPRATSGQAAYARVDIRYNKRGMTRQVVEGSGGSQPATVNTWYTPDGHVARVEDPLGQPTISTYDGIGRLEGVLAPDGTQTNYGYTGPKLEREWVKGDIEQGPSSLGGQTVRRILSETEFVTDANGRVVAETKKVFDPLGRASITAASAAGSASHGTFYSAAGKVLKERDPAGLETVNKYDSAGRLSQTELPGGHVIVFGYDGFLKNSVTATYQPDAGFSALPPAAAFTVKESVTFDALGRVIKKSDNRGVATEYAYDSFDNLRAIKTPASLVEKQYDAFSRETETSKDGVVSGSNPDGKIRLSFEYDLNDNRTAFVDDDRRRTTMEYDGRDQVKTVNQPDLQSVSIIRYVDGSPQTVTRGSGRRSEYEYVASGLLRRVLHHSGTTRTEQVFGFDGLGQCTYALDSNDSSDRNRVQRYRSYDSVGRLLRDRLVIPEFGFDQKVGYSFGADHKSRTVIYPGLSHDITYHTGSDGNVKKITELQSTLISRLHQGPDRILETRRRLIVQTQAPRPIRYDLGLFESHHYDASGRTRGRVVRIEDKITRPGVPNLMPFTEGEDTIYGADGLLETRIRGPVTTTYKYDGASRLLHYVEDDGSGRKLTEFDWDGRNRLHETAITSYRGSSLSTETNATTYRPDVRTRTDNFGPLSVVSTYDVHGRLTSSSDYNSVFFGTTTGTDRNFEYDAVDRLKGGQINIPAALGSNDYDPIYLYDGFGRLVARVGGEDGSSLASRPRSVFLHDGTRPILEYDKDGNQSRNYVYDEHGQLIAYRYIHPNTQRVISSLPLTSMEGSPIFLLDRRLELNQLPPNIPGPGASLTARLAYYRQWLPIVLEQHTVRPFGPNEIRQYEYYPNDPASSDVVEESHLPVDLAGQMRFPKEGLQLNGQRFYYPNTRSFITPDQTGVWADPSALGNPYTYAGNNPINYVDPTGFLAWDATSDVVFAAWGFGDAVWETELYRADLPRMDGTRVEGWDVAKAWGLFALDLVGLLPVIPNVTRPSIIFLEGYKAAITLGRRADIAIDAVRVANRGLGVYMAGSAAAGNYQRGHYLWGTGFALLAASGVRGTKSELQELSMKYRQSAAIRVDLSDVASAQEKAELVEKFQHLRGQSMAGELSVGSSVQASFKRQFYTNADGSRYPAQLHRRLGAAVASMPGMSKARFPRTAKQKMKGKPGTPFQYSNAQAKWADDVRIAQGKIDLPKTHVDHMVDLQFLQGRMVLSNGKVISDAANSRAGGILRGQLDNLKRAGWRPGSRIGIVDIIV